MNASSREKKFLLVGFLCIIVYCLYVYGIEPFYKKSKGIDSKIESKALFIKKYYEILNNGTYYKNKKQSNQILKTSLDEQFFNQKKASLASATLQKILESFARESSVAIISTRTEKTKYTEGLFTISVETTVQSTLKNLSRFLTKIENHKKLILIEEISIKKMGKNESPEQLKTKLRVNGFLKQLEPPKAKRS